VEWKIRLQAYQRGEGPKLDTLTVGSDCKCALGQWLYGDGAAFGSLAEFRQLKADHANFHKCAARVVTLIDRKDAPGAQSLLTGEYAAASSKVVMAISQLKRVTARAA